MDGTGGCITIILIYSSKPRLIEYYHEITAETSNTECPYQSCIVVSFVEFMSHQIHSI